MYIYAYVIRVGACMCIVHNIIDVYYIMCTSTAHNDESQEALEDSGYFSKISDELVGAIAISTH